MLNCRWSGPGVIGLLVVLGIALVPNYGAADGLSVSAQTANWKELLAQLGAAPPARGNLDEVVIFELKDKSNPKVHVRLGIPKKYLHSFEASSSSKTYRFTTIEAILPDMRPGSTPYGQSSIPSPTPEQLNEWRKQVTIEWTGGQPARDYSAEKHYSSMRQRLAQVAKTDFGLEHLRRRVCLGEKPGERSVMVQVDIPGKKCVWQGNDFFTFPPSSGTSWVRYGCTLPRGTFHGRCRANTLVRNWGIEYSFDRRELPRWRDIDNAVRQLVESFFVAGQKASEG